LPAVAGLLDGHSRGILSYVTVMTISTRWILALALLGGCGDDDGGAPVMVDAKVADAGAADAPPDAPPGSVDIATACMDVCNALGVCLGKSPGADCETECADDLSDCTPQEVMDVDACAQEDCGDMGEGIGLCLQQIACIDE
jgi:hypothetical protein